MGTEAFWVPAALTALSAGGQYVNQSQAQSRQNTDEVQALADQQKLRDQANGQVRALTNQVATDSPSKIAAQSTGDYVSQLRKNAAGSTQGGSTTGGTQTFGASTSALPPNSVAGANSRYGTDLAQGQSDVENFGNTYAQEMGQIDAATRMRQNEGLAAQTLGTNLNTLGQQSYGQNFVDQLRAQAAGQQNPWLAMASSLVGGAGSAMSKNPNAYFGQPPITTKVAPGLDSGNGLGDWAGAVA